MDMSFDIRPTTESDRTYIARLNYLTETFGDDLGELGPNFAADYEFYVDNWRPEQGGFVAWDNHIPLGGVWLVWGTDDKHGYGFVRDDIPELAIAVESRAAGRGLGTALIKAAIDLAEQLGAPSISLAVDTANPRAERLYRHLGFVPVSETPVDGYLTMVHKSL